MTTFQTLCKQIQTLYTEQQIKTMERFIDGHSGLSVSDKQDLFFLLELQMNSLPDINIACTAMPDWSWGRRVNNVFNN